MPVLYLLLCEGVILLTLSSRFICTTAEPQRPFHPMDIDGLQIEGLPTSGHAERPAASTTASLVFRHAAPTGLSAEPVGTGTTSNGHQPSLLQAQAEAMSPDEAPAGSVLSAEPVSTSTTSNGNKPPLLQAQDEARSPDGAPAGSVLSAEPAEPVSTGTTSNSKAWKFSLPHRAASSLTDDSAMMGTNNFLKEASVNVDVIEDNAYAMHELRFLGVSTNPVVAVTSLAMAMVLVVLAVSDSEWFFASSADSKRWATAHFTWLFIGAQNVWIVFIGYLWLSPSYYYLKLGRDDDTPEFNSITWFMMMFSSAGVNCSDDTMLSLVWKET